LRTGGKYWLKGAEEAPDMQTVNYDFGDLMLTWN
jgi:hypothetical protein